MGGGTVTGIITEESKYKIKPDDNFKIEFKKGKNDKEEIKGCLYILGSKETEIHGKESYLGLGDGMLSCLDMLNRWVKIYSIKLKDLKKTMNNRFPFVYHNIKDRGGFPTGIKLRESLVGELEVKIEEEEQGLKFKSKVVFSRKEYDIMRDYMEAMG